VARCPHRGKPRLRNLPEVLSSIESSRQQDILLNALDRATRKPVGKDGGSSQEADQTTPDGEPVDTQA
jgi:hypothetical protein